MKSGVQMFKRDALFIVVQEWAFVCII